VREKCRERLIHEPLRIQLRCPLTGFAGRDDQPPAVRPNGPGRGNFPQRRQPLLFQPQQPFPTRSLDRLDEPLVKARLLTEEAVLLVRTSCDGNEQRVGEASLPAQQSRQLATVHRRHGNVQEQGLGPVRRGDFERGGPVVSPANVRPPRLHQRGPAVSRILVVIDNQHTERAPVVRDALDRAARPGHTGDLSKSRGSVAGFGGPDHHWFLPYYRHEQSSIPKRV
jgi:hypothetical protein